MSLRLALYELVETHRLDAATATELDRIAGLDGEPEGARDLARTGLAVVAALLVGLGIVMWVAANWNELGRFGRFALLQGVVVATAAGAWRLPAARAPLGLLTLLGIGGLFAYFGQTYQTGADPWQLFALWALLGLPLVLALRSDVLWMPWALVAMTAISLWAHAHTGHRWRVEPGDLWVHGLAWTAATLLVTALAGVLRSRGGAGPWSLRTALLLAVTMVTLSAIGGLFARSVAPHYPLGMVALGALIGVCGFGRKRDSGAVSREPDIFGVSAGAFGLNVLIDAGLARWLFDGHGSHEPIGILLLLGLTAAGLLALTVSLILGLARRHGEPGEVQA